MWRDGKQEEPTSLDTVRAEGGQDLSGTVNREVDTLERTSAEGIHCGRTL